MTAFAARLRHATWSEQLQRAYMVFVGAGFLMLVLPAGIRHALRPLFFIGPLLPLIAKDLSHLPDALERSRAALRARAWRQLFAAWLPPELIGMLRLDGALRRGFAGWLLRRAPAQPPAARSFTYLEQGSYRTACAILLIATLVELPLDAALVPLLIEDESKRLAIHLLMLAGALSSLVYMLGDRWLIGGGRHLLTAAGLQLRIGARTHGTIPLDAIAACERIDEPMANWLKRHGIERRSAIKASPLDKPNTVLILKADSRVRLTHLGVERAGLRCIFLYLDRPQDLIHALAPR